MIRKLRGRMMKTVMWIVAIGFTISIVAYGGSYYFSRRPTPTEEREELSEAAATVNGENISMLDLNQAVAMSLRNSNISPQDIDQATLDFYRELFLEQLIDRELIYQDAKEQNIRPNKDEVNKIIKQTEQAFPSKADLLTVLNAYGWADLNDYRRSIERDIIIQERIKQVRDEVGEVSEEEAKIFYEENKYRYPKSAEVKLEQILVKDEEEAKKAQEKLVNEDFKTVAEEISRTNFQPDYMQQEDLFGDFKSSAFGLGVGDASNVITTMLGYHVIKLIERRAEHYPELGEVKEQVIDSILGEKRKEFINNKVAELQKEHDKLLEQRREEAKKEFPDVTEEELLEYYEASKPMYHEPEQVHAHHILVATEEEAEDILKELRAGVDFEQLAMEKSMEPAAKQTGGDLGYFSRGMMIPEFEEAAFSLEVGKISEPVKTSFGYHIIRVDDKKPERDPPLEEIRDRVEQDILLALRDTFVNPLRNKLNEEKEEKRVEYQEQAKTEITPDSITEEEIQDYFQENLEKYRIPEKRNILNIIFSTEEQAEDLVKKIGEDPKVFDDMFTKVSKGEVEGAIAQDLGFITRSEIGNSLEQIAFSLEAGDISQIMESIFGYHLIKIEDKKAASTRAFEEVKEQIYQDALEDKQSTALRNFINSLKRSAEIVNHFKERKEKEEAEREAAEEQKSSEAEVEIGTPEEEGAKETTEESGAEPIEEEQPLIETEETNK